MLSARAFISWLLFLYAFRVLVLIRQQQDVTAIDAYSVLQIAIIFLLAMTLLLMHRTLMTAIEILKRSPMWYLLLLYLFGVVSYLWSAIPNLSGYFAFQGATLMIGVTVYFCHQTLRGRFERAVLLVSLLLLAMNVVGHAKIHSVGFGLGGWHTNSYSAVAAMLAAYCLGELVSKKARLIGFQLRRLLWGTLLISLFFLVLGTSSGSNVAFVAGLFVAAIYSGRFSFKVAALVFFVLVFILNLYFADQIFSMLFPGKTLENIESMTGRKTLWEFYLRMIEERPWLGWGFATPERLGQIYTTNTHNIVLAITASLGMIGLGLFVLYLIAVVRIALFGRYRAHYAGVVCALAVGLVNGMTVGFLASGAGPVFLAFIVWNVVLALKPLSVKREMLLALSLEAENRPKRVAFDSSQI